MRYLKVLFITISCLLLCGACNYRGNQNKTSTVNNALDNMLQCDNYTVEWEHEYSVLFEGRISDYVSSYESTIFHFPYRAKMTSSSNSNEEENVLNTGYQVERNGKVYVKLIFKNKDGSIEEFDRDSDNRTDEWFLIQLQKNLVSEDYIEEQNISEANIKKYKISVRPYPFVIFLEIPYDRNDKLTRIFLDEYESCEGYVYINSNNEIQKIEFDLSNKFDVNEKINERYKTETMYPFDQIKDYRKLKISISFSHINDNSPDILEIEEEIEEKMR